MNDARRGDFRFWMAFVVSELVIRHHASIAILTFGGPEVHTYVYSMYHAQISIDHRKFVYLQVFGFFRMLSAVSSYIYRVFGKLNPVVALQTQNPGLWQQHEQTQRLKQGCDTLIAKTQGGNPLALDALGAIDPFKGFLAQLAVLTDLFDFKESSVGVNADLPHGG
jgi:hypothetical protein